MSGETYLIQGLKGTGKNALLRYLNEIIIKNGDISELILFKSDIGEEDRQQLSKGAGYEVVGLDGVNVLIQDFKETWKWLIYQKLAEILQRRGFNTPEAVQLYKITGVHNNKIITNLGGLFSKIKFGGLKLSGEALGVALELGIEGDKKENSISISSANLNRHCSVLLNAINLEVDLYILFDELELFHQTSDQFDRDRRIIRDLIFAISSINAESAENKRRIYLISTLRTEVLHSIVEMGHEISRDVDDFGQRLDWYDAIEGPQHPLLKLIARKISYSTGIEENRVWDNFFPERISNQTYFKFILGSSYYRPRDIVRLLRIARDFDGNSTKFTSAHFEQTAIEFSRQTWLEVTEELLASYSQQDISALERLFLGSHTHFYKDELRGRIMERSQNDVALKNLLNKKDISNILSDLYRIGVIGNDFYVNTSNYTRVKRNRWIFRGNVTLVETERMSVHKSLWKHLSLAT